LMLTYSQANGLRAYCDGVMSTNSFSGSGEATSSYATPVLNIGWDGNGNTNAMNGILDSIRVYRGVEKDAAYALTRTRNSNGAFYTLGRLETAGGIPATMFSIP
jgi:hypothetical protein